MRPCPCGFFDPPPRRSLPHSFLSFCLLNLFKPRSLFQTPISPTGTLEPEDTSPPPQPQTMSALTDSRKRDASAFLADADPQFSKRMRRGARLSPPPGLPDCSSVELQVGNNIPADGKQWVEIFVKEMTGASDMNDAKNRAFRLLEVFEKSVTECNAAEATKTYQEEHNKLKEQMNSLLHENDILKRAVTIQHKHLKEYGDKVKELDGLKETLSQYQEKIRTLELNNYALAMHLKQAQDNGPIQGHYNRDIF